MPEKAIIADTSVLIALGNIRRLELLHKVYGSILITPQVQLEFGEQLPDWISVEEVRDSQKIVILNLELDLGEASAISLATETPNSLLVIDERKGRIIAKRMGIAVTGILGILINGKKKGIISEIKPIIENLERVGFRISTKLKIQVLAAVGE